MSSKYIAATSSGTQALLREKQCVMCVCGCACVCVNSKVIHKRTITAAQKDHLRRHHIVVESTGQQHAESEAAIAPARCSLSGFGATAECDSCRVSPVNGQGTTANRRSTTDAIPVSAANRSATVLLTAVGISGLNGGGERWLPLQVLQLVLDGG